MNGLMAGWQRRSGPERFEAYTRWTLYVLLAMIPFMAVGLVAVSFPDPPADGYPVLYPLATLVQVVVAIVVIRRGITDFSEDRPQGRAYVLPLLLVTAATAVVAATSLPTSSGAGWEGAATAVALALTTGLFALTPSLGTNWLSWIAIAIGGVSALLVDGTLSGSQLATHVALTVLVVGGMALSFRISIWMLGIVWEQERSRGLQARLAVAEERLRFSRDLHDVVGRALSAVTLKSELAAELSRRGQREDAAEQMLEVRELASGSLREVRAVVAGYRRADLAAELAGARSMLRSAGVATRVIGDEDALPAPVQEALAWVVREGVTNVVRHSTATTCTIDVAVEDDDGVPVARLRLTNDGAPSGTPAGDGSGLVGLAERLAPLGGSVATTNRHGTFALEARVPTDAVAAPPTGIPDLVADDDETLPAGSGVGAEPGADGTMGRS